METKTTAPGRRAVVNLSRVKALLGRFSLFIVGFFLGRFRSVRGGNLDPFENGARRGVALALVQADDAGVAAGTILEDRGNLFEENSRGIFLVQARHGQTTVAHGAA